MLENMAPGSSTPDIGVGTLLVERYRLDAVVGRGGMATVFRAHDTALERDVAIKVFADGDTDPAAPRRRQDEMRLLARLDHPALVTLFDCVTDDDGRTVLVMQFVDGDDLGAALASGPLPPPTVAALGADLAEALAYLAAEGIVHRDVKPGNILVPANPGNRRAHALLTDLGIARLVDSASVTVAGTIVGTVSYLSPEQALGASLGPESDVYSLGLVLIESLTGIRCFTGPTAESVAARLSRDPEVPDALGPDWVDLLRRMTAREPGERIAARDAAVALRGLAGRAGSAATAPTRVLAGQFPTAPAEQPTARVTAVLDAPQTPAPRPAQRPSGRSRVVLLALAAIAVLIASALGALAWNAQQGETPTGTSTGSPIVEYPAVPGDLGAHLRQLQDSVASLPEESAATAESLRTGVLSVTQSSADEDYRGALDRLDVLEGDLDDALDRDAVTGDQYDEILAAIELVRDDLTAALEAQEDRPGNSENGNGNGRDKDKDKDD